MRRSAGLSAVFDAPLGPQVDATLSVRWTYDVFADLSGTAFGQDTTVEHVRLLLRDGGFATAAGRLTVALPPGVAADATLAAHAATGLPAMHAFSRALAGAQARRKHLCIVLGGLLPANETVAALADALQADPLFGSAQPRFAESATDRIWPLPARAEGGFDEPQTSRAALPFLPGLLVTAELLAGCLLVRREVISAMQPPEGFASVAGALAFSLCQARRRGFRNVVVNRAVVVSRLGADAAYPSPLPAEAARLLDAYPDSARAVAENERKPQRRLEALLSAARPAAAAPRPLLVECRGLVPMHNGTSQCVLGLLDGIAALAPPWRIDVLSSSESGTFHELARRYPTFRHTHDQVSGRYAAALMLNQPWSVDTVAELHRHALVVVFNILDTIGWDIIYAVDERVDAAWRFAARHADGLTYISRFSQERFRRRFPLSPGVGERVAHLSFAMDEQTLPGYRGLPPGEHVLLFGNAYDHKGLEPALQLVVEAFPFQRFVVLGSEHFSSPRVRTVPSGQASGDEVHRLIATARAIVYPSFYEGFGLPVVEGLAYGRPVLVRRSPLWAEIAACSRLPGQLVEFEDDLSLVEGLGRVLAGLPVPGLPSGGALGHGEAAAGWRDCAGRMLDLVEERTAGIDAQRWLDREEALRAARL